MQPQVDGARKGQGFRGVGCKEGYEGGTTSLRITEYISHFLGKR